jgi:hypothetical protein
MDSEGEVFLSDLGSLEPFSQTEVIADVVQEQMDVLEKALQSESPKSPGYTPLKRKADEGLSSIQFD